MVVWGEGVESHQPRGAGDPEGSCVFFALLTIASATFCLFYVRLRYLGPLVIAVLGDIV